MNSFFRQMTSVRVLSWLVFFLCSMSMVHGVISLVGHLRSVSALDYNEFGISDWLINYEGGFVRRGLMGELLWLSEQFHSYDVRYAILALVAVFSIVILLVLLRIFRQHGWSLLIIPSGFCLGFTFLVIYGRRDFLALLVTFAIFYIYRHLSAQPRHTTDTAAKLGKATGRRRHVGNGFTHYSNWLWQTGFYVLSVLQILIHEASFFFTFPILMFCCYQTEHIRGRSCAGSLLVCIVRFLPVLLAMAVVCLFKGDGQTARVIWASWGDVLSSHPSDTPLPDIGQGVLVLEWGTKETVLNHLQWSYIGLENASLWHFPLALFNLLAAYYLLTRLDSVDMGLYPHRVMDSRLMSNVVIVQFISMLPMYLGLSCDWGRTIPYWVISSIFFYHLFRNEGLSFPSLTDGVSVKIQGLLSGSRVLRSPYFYILLVFFSPVPRSGAPFEFPIHTFQGYFYLQVVSKVTSFLPFLQ